MPSEPCFRPCRPADESDPSAMLGLVALVVVAELLAIVVGVALGFLVG